MVPQFPAWGMRKKFTEQNTLQTFKFASNLMSVAILWAVAPNDASGDNTSISTLREYVCEVTGYA